MAIHVSRPVLAVSRLRRLGPPLGVVLLGTLGGVLASRLSHPELLVVVLLVAAGVGLVLRQPLWGLYAVLAVLLVKLQSVRLMVPGINLALAPWIGISLLLFAIMSLRAPADWYRRVLTLPLTPPLLSFLALALASFLWAENRGLWLRNTIALGVSAALYVMVVLLVNSRPRFEAVCKVLGFTAILYGLWGIVDYAFYFLGLPSHTLPVHLSNDINPPRARGAMDDPNFFASYLVVLLPLALAWALQLRSRWRWCLWVVALLVVMSAVMLSGSRGTLAATGVLFILILLMTLPRHPWLADGEFARGWRWVVGGALAVAGLGVLLLLAFSPLNVLRLVKTFSDAGGLGAGRAMIWYEILREAPSHPLGVGVGNREETAALASHGTRGRPGHNVFLHLLGELGIPGELLYLWILFEVVRTCRRRWRDNSHARWLVAIGLSLLAYHLCGMFVLSYLEALLYILFGLLMAGERMIRREEQTTSLLPARSHTQREA
jgi:hypothetical protein